MREKYTKHIHILYVCTILNNNNEKEKKEKMKPNATTTTNK